MAKTFKVIKIINDKTLIINAGREDGVYNEDDIEIYSPGMEITDPDTGESLGTLDYVKATLEVTNAMPKMSECKNVVVKKEKTLSMLSYYDDTREVKTNETININPLDISGGYEGVDPKVRVGDLVRIIGQE